MTRALLSHHSVPDKTGVYNEPEGAVALSDVSTRSDVSLPQERATGNDSPMCYAAVWYFLPRWGEIRVVSLLCHRVGVFRLIDIHVLRARVGREKNRRLATYIALTLVEFSVNHCFSAARGRSRSQYVRSWHLALYARPCKSPSAKSSRRL